MQRFELYLREGDDTPEEEALVDTLLGLGCRLQGGAGYRPGSWNDTATGARAVLDLGNPPIEEDVQHPPRAYASWTPLRLAIQLPLVCPHWQAVEGFQLIEHLLAAIPGAFALDCEDIQETKDAEAGPFAWSRPRALASWERQHAAQIETRTDLARMGRGDSLRLWRWRRERETAWPAATVLRERTSAVAHAVCVWPDPTAPCVLPSIGLVLVQADKPLLLRRDALPAGEPLAQAGGALVAPPASWPASLPLARFVTCDDDMWID